MSGVPKYCKQKTKSRPDRAYCRIDSKTIMLGLWNSPESRQRYAAVVKGEDPQPEPNGPLPVEELLASYLDHIDQYHGRVSLKKIAQSDESHTGRRLLTLEGDYI